MAADYCPRPEQEHILRTAMEYIRSAPYHVTARWLFYRLLQNGLYRGKADYHGKFLPLISEARKRFYREWSPSTLADDTRKATEGGDGFDSPADWLRGIEGLEFTKDKWENQDNYIEIWFEAAAMQAQFEYYTHEIPLLAFHGDISIPQKWTTAQRLDGKAEKYGLPIVIIYFGDDDPKGWQIPTAALADIRKWCVQDFTFVRGGLNEGDGQRLGLPENPDKPGTYQWEALDDENAGDMIYTAISQYYNEDALEEIREEEHLVTEKFQKHFAELRESFEQE